MEEGCSSLVSKPSRDGYVPSSSGINPISPRGCAVNLSAIDRERLGWMTVVLDDLNIPADNEEMSKVKELFSKSATHRITTQRTNWLYFWSGGYDIWLLKASLGIKLEKYAQRRQIYQSKFCTEEEQQNNDKNDNNDNNDEKNNQENDKIEPKLKEQMEDFLDKAWQDIKHHEQNIQEYKEKFKGRMKFLFCIWDETEFFSPFETIGSSSEKLERKREDTYIIRLSTTAVGHITMTKRTLTSVTHRRLPIVGERIYDAEYLKVVKNQLANPNSISPYVSPYTPTILNYIQIWE